MADERIVRLAENILRNSIRIQPGELFEINGSILAKPLIKELMKQGAALGAAPFVKLNDEELRRLSYGFIDPEHPQAAQEILEKRLEWELGYYKHICAHVDIGVTENDAELGNVDTRSIQLCEKVLQPMWDIIIDQRRWVYLHWPTMADAERAQMCYDDFFDFFLSAVSADYSAMKAAAAPLKEWMERADIVEITGPGTQLRFSIKGMNAVICAGEMNLPDGEVFTAPVKESVEGTIRYNTPASYMGKRYLNPVLRFEKGRIVEASCDNDTPGFNALLDGDEGARYIGEFALGFNNAVTKAIGNTLYDEKIGGSFHLTPGCCYEEVPNGNKSALHLDIVSIQTLSMGGGEIRFDGVPVRRDGLFLPKELEGLNP